MYIRFIINQESGMKSWAISLVLPFTTLEDTQALWGMGFVPVDHCYRRRFENKNV